MAQLGMGVMLNMLGGNEETAVIVSEAIGKTIKEVKVADNELQFTFNDNTKIALFDDGQSCCEHRYMNCDDDLTYYVDCQLLSVEIRDGGSKKDHYETKETQFLIVTTSLGSFTVANYNEHNGYYGGFWIAAKKKHV